jgi:hypothetical protein
MSEVRFFNDYHYLQEGPDRATAHPGRPERCVLCLLIAARDTVAALARRTAERDAFQQKYHDCMAILSAWDNLDKAEAIAQRNAARAALQQACDIIERISAPSDRSRRDQVARWRRDGLGESA